MREYRSKCPVEAVQVICSPVQARITKVKVQTGVEFRATPNDPSPRQALSHGCSRLGFFFASTPPQRLKYVLVPDQNRLYFALGDTTVELRPSRSA
jgi:hypothetical protein